MLPVRAINAEFVPVAEAMYVLHLLPRSEAPQQAGSVLAVAKPSKPSVTGIVAAAHGVVNVATVELEL